MLHTPVQTERLLLHRIPTQGLFLKLPPGQTNRLVYNPTVWVGKISRAVNLATLDQVRQRLRFHQRSPSTHPRKSYSCVYELVYRTTASRSVPQITWVGAKYQIDYTVVVTESPSTCTNWLFARPCSSVNTSVTISASTSRLVRLTNLPMKLGDRFKTSWCVLE